MDEPLIYTTLGNMPESALEYRHYWEDTDGFVKFTEEYRLDGEIVKSSSHILLKKGIGLEIEAGSF